MNKKLKVKPIKTKMVDVMIRHSRSKYEPHVGKKEKARRVKQKNRGMI